MADFDCVIIGGGPAGLTGAIYASRFRLSVLVIDAGASRAALIPCTHNHAGFPHGVSGVDLLRRMRDQAETFGVAFMHGQATELDGDDSDGFTVRGDFGTVTARSVLLATGVTNRRPPMDEAEHAQALATGLIRYCPVCDGYEVTDKRVAVLGTGDHAVTETVFLRAYTSDLTLVSPEGPHALDLEQRARLKSLGVELIDGPATVVVASPEAIDVRTGAATDRFDTLYPALGSIIHSDLAGRLGADLAEEGCIEVDSHQRTSIAGLYAAGDVVAGLDQISRAMGTAAVAVTTLRNDLADKAEIMR